MAESIAEYEKELSMKSRARQKVSRLFSFEERA